MYKLTSFILAGLLALCVAITLVCASGANAADGFSKDTMKRMGTFVSNFTELGMTNLPDAQNLPDEQYVAFGVRHEWVNNHKRFKMGDGVASIEASHIENAVMRYFGKAFKAHRAVPDHGIQYDPATKRYTIPMADGEMRTYARVESVTQNADGTLVMRGTLYNAKNTKETFGPFTAKAKPHKWNGKDTWALLSLELTSETASGANSKPAMSDALPVQATGTNGSQDIKELTAAAEAGDAEAQYKLGFAYYMGRGVERDAAKAVEWFTKAAEQGHAEAQYQLGWMYKDKDDAKAAEWYLKAAKQGHVEAQGAIGRAYEDGEGVARDAAKAAEWYLKAAEQGEMDAQCRIAVAYDKGKGVEQDSAKAAKWYLKSAEQGHAVAQYEIAFMYYNGRGVEKDLVAAYRWLLVTEPDGGGADIEEALEVCRKELTPEQIKEAESKAKAHLGI